MTTRRKGRPPVDPTGDHARINLTLAAQDYDRLYALAQRSQQSIPEVVRKALRVAFRQDRPKA